MGRKLAVLFVAALVSVFSTAACAGPQEKERLISNIDYEEGREDVRQEIEEREGGSSRGGGGNAFTAAVIAKYVTIIVVVLIVAYVVLQILGTVQGAL